ncbi:MAG: hypothetical protein JRF27_04745, partial [Deltaproteobacteria bacterium]|nr:hypothetical protein [Deltaproteobacteria bacterium]
MPEKRKTKKEKQNKADTDRDVSRDAEDDIYNEISSLIDELTSDPADDEGLEGDGGQPGRERGEIERKEVDLSEMFGEDPEDGGEIRESVEAPEVKDTGRDIEKPIEIDETPPENGERPREMPEGPTVEAKTPAAADDEVETRQGATEQGVADVFRLFEAEPENGGRRQEIPENADVEVKMETAAGEVETRKGEIERGVE